MKTGKTQARANKKNLIHSDDINTWLEQAGNYKTQKNWKKAIEFYEKIPENRRHDSVRLSLAVCYQLYQHPQQARAILEAMDKSDAVLLMLGHLLKDIGEYSEAEAAYKQISDYRRNKKALLGLKFLYEKSHNNEAVLAVFQWMDELDPNDSTFALAKVRFYEGKHNYREANKHLKKILENDAKDRLAVLAQANYLAETKQYDKAITVLNSIIDPNQPDKIVLSTLAKFYREAGNFDKAEEQYIKIPNYKNDKEVSLTLAMFYQKSNNHGKAKELFSEMLNKWPEDKKILLAWVCYCQEVGDYGIAENVFAEKAMAENWHWSEDKEFLLARARLFQTTKQYKKAEEIYTSICEKWPQDSSVLLYFARFYQEINKYELAEEMLKKHSGYDTDKDIILSRALLAAEKYDFYKAIDLFREMLRQWSDDKRALLGLARCYQKMGNYDEAKKCYLKIPNYQTDKETQISLARFYQEKKDYKAATETFESMLLQQEWKDDKQVLLGLARCYAEMGWYSIAEKKFNAILQLAENKEALLGLARLYQEQEKYHLAIETFSSMYQKWPNDRQVELGLAHCYREMGMYKRAENVLRQHDDIEDKEMLLTLLRIYEESGNNDAFCKTLDELQRLFPNNDKHVLFAFASYNQRENNILEAKYYFDKLMILSDSALDVRAKYIDLLLKVNQLGEAKQLLSTFKEKFPFYPAFYLLESKLANQRKKFDNGLSGLIQLVNQFPFYTQGYLALIKQCFQLGKTEDANKYIQQCYEKFTYYDKLYSAIEKARHFKLPFQYDALNLDITHKKIDLFSLLGDAILQELNQLGSGWCLVGSIIESLMQQKQPSKGQDIDVVIPTNVSGIKLIEKDYHPSMYRKDQYTKILPTVSLDVSVASSSADGEDLIDKDFYLRDFTISAVFCDKDGCLYDPTGIGINDIRNKILRTVQPASICFADDPVRLLRATRWIVAGYRPTTDVDNALKNFSQDLLKGHQLSRLHAYTRKILKRGSIEQHQAFINTLKQYGLLEKLFKIPNEENTATALEELKAIVFPPKYPKKDSFSFFSQEKLPLAIEHFNLAEQAKKFPYLSFWAEEKSTKQEFKSMIQIFDTYVTGNFYLVAIEYAENSLKAFSTKYWEEHPEDFLLMMQKMLPVYQKINNLSTNLSTEPTVKWYST